MSNPETRFNNVAQSLGLAVRWKDEGAELGAEAAKVEARIAELDSYADQFSVSGAPSIKVSREMTVLGNSVIFDEVTRLIKAHGDSTETIQTVTPTESLKAPIETRLISGLNLDGDKYADFLLVRSFEIFAAPDEAVDHRTVSFIAAIRGNGEQNPSADMIKSAKLLGIASYDGTSNPINGVEVKDDNGDGVHEVTYKAFDKEKEAFLSHTASFSGDNSPGTKEIFDAVFSVATYYYNTFGYFDILMGAENEKGGKGPAYQAAIQSTIFNRLSFAFRELETRYGNASADSANGVFIPHMRVLVEEARKVLILSEADKKLEGALKAATGEIWSAERGKFLWNGEKMSRSAFYNALRTTSDPKTREKLVKAYSEATLKAAKNKEKGLFGAIDKFNEMARKYGFKNYAELVVKVYNFADVDSFAEMINEVHEREGREIEAFIADLRAVNGGREVNEWDVPYLTEQLVSQRAGVKEIPALTAEEAFAVTKKFYADIGIDLDKAPFAGNIHFDTKLRDNKYGNAFMTLIRDGSKAWFNTNFDPKKKVSLDEDLATMIHETMHAVQSIAGAENAGGSAYTNAINAQTLPFAEGLGVAMQNRVYDPLFVDRYLADIPEFSDQKFRAVLSEEMGRKKRYEDMRNMLRARLEMELYFTEDENGKYRSVDERLKTMVALVEKYQHVNAEADKLDIWSVPHVSLDPLYYSNYTLATGTARLAISDIIDAMQGARPMNGAAKMLLDIFKEGSKLRTLDDIENFVNEAKGIR